MVNDRSQLARYLDQYDELAGHVVDDERPNSNHGLPWCNAEMVQIILSDMDWDSFDLFQNIDFAAAYKSDQKEEVRAFCFLAYLRMDLFAAAHTHNIGDSDFNHRAATQSEYWFLRLKDRFESLYKNATETKHGWLH